MNDHQQCANYILTKMRQVMIPGEESETHSKAKDWLQLIINGHFNVEEITDDSGDKPIGVVRDRA